VSLYDHIVACNTHDLGRFRPFIVAGERVGWVRHELAAQLERWPEVFDPSGERVTVAGGVGGAADELALAGNRVEREDLGIRQHRRQHQGGEAGAGADKPSRVVAIGRLELDHVSAEISEDEAATRPHDHVRQLDDPYPGEWFPGHATARRSA